MRAVDITLGVDPGGYACRPLLAQRSKVATEIGPRSVVVDGGEWSGESVVETVLRLSRAAWLRVYQLNGIDVANAEREVDEFFAAVRLAEAEGVYLHFDEQILLLHARVDAEIAQRLLREYEEVLGPDPVACIEEIRETDAEAAAALSATWTELRRLVSRGEG